MISSVKPGIYKHYSGKIYQVIGTCHHSETLEALVVYKALYDCEEFGNESLWVRPVEMFFESVIIDGKEQPRFAELNKR